MIATLKHGGLPEGVRRSGFIEYIAPALKARGISTSAISYLSKALENWTRDQDFAPNRVCGFWHKVGCLAEKLSVTGRVGGNLNQIARWLNRAVKAGHVADIDALKVAAQLVAIERQLAQISKAAKC